MIVPLAPVPRWDLEAVYPGLASPVFRRDLDALARDVAALAALFDAHGVRRRPPAPLDAAAVAAFEAVAPRYDAALLASWKVDSYAAAFIDTDAGDEQARAVYNELRPLLARLEALGWRFAGWVGALDVDDLLARSPLARDLAHPLRRLKELGRHAMTADEEALAADLHPCGGGAWARLHADVTATMTAPLPEDGGARSLPMGELRALAADPDRSARRRAYEAEVAAWEANALPLAAALNGVKGEAVTLAGRRGWDGPLEEALAIQGLDRSTLDALLEATRQALPDFRRYLRAKARLLGVPALAWYDLSAPVGDGGAWTFAEAASLVTERFRASGPAMGDLAERAFHERWVDAEPRPGKRGGGLCYWLGDGVSRVRLEFRPGYDSVRTLAHELGHAYHADVLARAGASGLQVEAMPATLAETASKVCEEVVREELLRGARERGRPGEELALLDGFLTAARRSVVESLAHFLFEDRFFAQRRTRELPAAEINALMLVAQAETDGDALDPAAPYPWGWAARPHLFLDGVSFYNLPYLFGLLLALGLSARRRADPDAFHRAFDALLASTGRADPVALAADIGVDLRSPSFWREGCDAIRADIDRFEALAAAAA